MTKKGDVWSDLEFLERALELASNDYLRDELAVFVEETKERVVKRIERDFIEGMISAQTYKNIIGCVPNRELAKKSIAWHQAQTVSIPENEYTVFSRKAVDMLMKMSFLNAKA